MMSRQALSQGLVAQLDWCPDCDVVHLHVGAVTLRLQPSVLHDLRDTLSRAVTTLEVVRTAQNPSRTAVVPAARRHCH